MDSKLSKEELNIKRLFDDDDRFTYIGSEGTVKANFKFEDLCFSIQLMIEKYDSNRSIRHILNDMNRVDKALYEKTIEIINYMLFNNPDVIKNNIKKCQRDLCCIINGIKYYIQCPSTLGFEEDCSLSCEECFKRNVLSQANLVNHGIEPKEAIKFKINSQIKNNNLKKKVINRLKDNSLKFPFILEEEKIVLCPSSIYMENTKDCDGILNEKCKTCWRNARKEFFEGEE